MVLPVGATRDATVHYGALDPASIELNWIQVSGPGGVNFGNGTNEDTTVTVPMAGSYTFALVATPEDEPPRSGEVTVIFRDSYEAWVLRRFDAPEQSASERLADPDGDGLANLVEFALGLDPGFPDADTLLSPFLSEDGALSMVYLRPYLSDDYRIVPEVSSDLVVWESGRAFVSESVLNSTAEGEWVQAEDLFPVDGVTPRFIRLRVSGQE